MSLQHHKYARDPEMTSYHSSTCNTSLQFASANPDLLCQVHKSHTSGTPGKAAPIWRVAAYHASRRVAQNFERGNPELNFLWQVHVMYSHILHVRKVLGWRACILAYSLHDGRVTRESEAQNTNSHPGRNDSPAAQLWGRGQ